MKPTLVCQRLGPGDGLVEHFHHQDAEDDECGLLRAGHLPPEVGRLVSRAKAARRGPGVRNFIAFSIRLLPKEI